MDHLQASDDSLHLGSVDDHTLPPHGGDASVNIGVRKGSWTEEEDVILRAFIEKHGEGNWHQVPKQAGLNRCRKSCRLRWLNYLRPNIKRGRFTSDEVDLIVRLHKLLGNRWSLIAGRLPGRTANDVKNCWNTRIHKKTSAGSSSHINNINLRRQTTVTTTTANNNNNTLVVKPRAWVFSKTSPWVMRSQGPKPVEKPVLPILATVPTAEESTSGGGSESNDGKWWEGWLEENEDKEYWSGNSGVLLANKDKGSAVANESDTVGDVDPFDWEQLFMEVDPWEIFGP